VWRLVAVTSPRAAPASPSVVHDLFPGSLSHRRGEACLRLDLGVGVDVEGKDEPAPVPGRDNTRPASRSARQRRSQRRSLPGWRDAVDHVPDRPI
jgi:hypothetical protein